MGPSRWLALHGIHEPWIAEISPMQMGLMSARQKKIWQERRSKEWAASIEGKRAWANAVFAAYDAGAFTLKTERAHPDAVAAVRTELIARAKQTEEAAKKAAHLDNRIRSVEEVAIGDRIYDLMYSRYVHVLKKFKTSFRVRDENGKEYTGNFGRFQRYQYNDVPVPGRAAGKAPRGVDQQHARAVAISAPGRAAGRAAGSRASGHATKPAPDPSRYHSDVQYHLERLGMHRNDAISFTNRRGVAMLIEDLRTRGENAQSAAKILADVYYPKPKKRW
jgi:hypothetical protein